MKLGFLFGKFKEEVLKSAKNGEFLDYFEVYLSYVEDFKQIFCKPERMQGTFRKSVAEFIDERVVSLIFYQYIISILICNNYIYFNK